MNTQALICNQCKKNFIFASFDRLYNNSVPNICPICRKKMTEDNRRKREALENMKWREEKMEQQKTFEKRLKEYHVVAIETICPHNNDVLYILGNGFDMMHGVKSSYYNFRDSMGRHNRLRRVLEDFWIPEDIWADFENALAQFNMRAMSSNYIVDNHLDVSGAYDKDAGMTEFYMAVEMAADPITTVATELPKQFRRWVEGLTIGTTDRPLQCIFKNGRVLCFNYTEFVEELYGVASENVCYLHGCRRNRKDTLILGHIPGSSDEMYDFEDSGIPTKNKQKQYLIQAAQDNIYRLVSESDETLTKHSNQIIAAYQSFFSALQDTKDIIVIGHSMSEVDMDYFCEVIRHLKNRTTVNWYIGCHGLRDLENMEGMLKKLSITKEQVTIFRTDLISVSLDHANNEKCTDSRVKKERFCGNSPHGTWQATSTQETLKIYHRQNKTLALEIIFSQPIHHVVFSADETYMFVVIRGLESGIFLFAYEDSTWHFINELESISHQSLLNPRLRHVYLTESTITFVYNNRMRKYSLSDGTLTDNRARRYANGYSYSGTDIKHLFWEK